MEPRAPGDAEPLVQGVLDERVGEGEPPRLDLDHQGGAGRGLQQVEDIILGLVHDHCQHGELEVATDHRGCGQALLRFGAQAGDAAPDDLPDARRQPAALQQGVVETPPRPPKRTGVAVDDEVLAAAACSGSSAQWRSSSTRTMGRRWSAARAPWRTTGAGHLRRPRSTLPRPGRRRESSRCALGVKCLWQACDELTEGLVTVDTGPTDPLIAASVEHGRPAGVHLARHEPAQRRLPDALARPT